MGLLEYTKGKRDTTGSSATRYDDSDDPSNLHIAVKQQQQQRQHRTTEKSSSNSNSTFAQRYLAAILDNDVVELIYPPSPARQQQEKKQDRQQQQQQLQGTSSPSGRSKSSHTTKSTKYTVRTVGSDSMTPTTPASSTATTSPTGMMKLRRKLQQQQPSPSTTMAMATNPISTSTSTSTRPTTKVHQISSRSYNSTEYRNAKSTNHKNQSRNESTTSSPSRNSTKGFFARTLLQKQNDRELRPTVPSPPRSTNNNNNANSYNLSIRKWKQKIRTTSTKNNDNSVSTSIRPLPSSTNKYSKTEHGLNSSSERVHSYGQQQNHYNSSRKNNDDGDNSNNDNDDNSSLTSRHTTERRRSHRHRGRSFRRHDDDEDEYISSYEDDDDDEYMDDDDSTSSDNQGQPLDRVHRGGTQINNSNNQSSQKMFSIVEKTVEDGLDMIFNTNGWTCVVPQQLVGEEQQQQQVSLAVNITSKSRKMVLPSNVRDTKHIQETTTTAKIATPPPYQRRMQRHYDDNNAANSSIRLSTSMETPQSDGGATDIITNRAMDIALKRIHQMENIPVAVGDALDNVHFIPEQHYQDSRSSYSKPVAVTPEQDTPIQLYPSDQNNSNRRAPQSRVKQAANIFENQSRTYQNKISTTKTTTANHINNGKLGLHLRDKKQQQQLLEQTTSADGDVKSIGGGTNKSLSSSVGVEIDARYRIPNRSQFRMKVNAPQQQQYQQRPPLIETPSDEWMNVELPYEPEISNRSKSTTLVHRSYGNNRTTVEPVPLHSTLFRSQTPTRRIYNTVDPCMSPPQIVRKPQQSYDEMSPDPIFCSKSMSMSIQSSNLFSPEHSSNNSVAPSCQTDDAMFMERPDESCSSFVSHIQNSVNGDSTKMQPNDILGYQSKGAREVSTSRTETTFDSRTEEERVLEESPTTNEQSSPYMEILGIRGTFPTAPNIPDRGYSTPQQIPHYQMQMNLTESTVPKLIPLVPLDSPSPPPLIGDSLNLSREYYQDTYSKEQSSSSNVKLLLRCSPKLKDTSYDGKTSSRTIIAKPEPVRSKPTFVPGFGVNHDQSNTYSSNNALAMKLSRSGASLNESDADGRSIDVKSIRSAFESLIGSLDATIENDSLDNDDDTASVRSLRDRFEPPKVVVPTENRISKTRAIFEKNANVRKYPDSKSHASRILDRRMLRIDDNNRAKDKLQHVNTSNVLLLSSDSHNNVENPNEVEAVVEKQSISVADRVRAFNVGQQNQMRVKEINNIEGVRFASAISRNNPNTSMTSGNKLNASTTLDTKTPVPIASPKLVDLSTSKRSPRNKVSSLRFLGGKAFSCGPAKELTQSFDSSLDGKNQVETNSAKFAHHAARDKRSEKETSSTAVNSECISIRRHPADSDVSACAGDVDQPFKMANDNRSAAKKPLWMEQREKILSRSRPIQRVKDAACESKKETALIISSSERDYKESKTENKFSNVGEIRHTALKGSDEPVNALKSSDVPVKSHITKGLAQQPSSRDTIEQYDLNFHPAYELRRSQSENVRPVYKFQSKMKQIDHLLPFCLQTPNSNEDFLTVNTNQTGQACESPSNIDVFDEKKEESLCGEAQYSEASKNTSERKQAADSMLEIYLCDRTDVKSSSKPIVVKPVARKPYVRPVPLKPLPESLQAIPFGRSISDPTASLIPCRAIAVANRSSNAESRFLPRAMMDNKYATLELPRLSDNVSAPLVRNEIEESVSESSDFSDGVTLDLSIADVSNLTTPTALVSKVECGHNCNDQTESKMSEDEWLHGSHHKSKKNRDPDSEAKQSEASSSQTSEAAAPLLARALGTYPLSDEISTDSFFRDRAILAKQKWNLRGSSNQMSKALFEESSKDDDSRFSGSDTDEIWDIRQVESLFPNTTMKQITQVQIERSFGVWHPFTVDLVDNSKTDDKNVISKDDQKGSLLYLPAGTFDTSPSRSKTPTRRNTSRTVSSGDPSTLPIKIFTDVSSTSMMVDDLCRGNQHSKESAVSSIYLESEASYPLQSSTSSNTNRTTVSNLLSSSISGASLIGGRYNILSTNSGVKSSTKITVSSSNSTSTYGPRQSTLQSYSNKSTASSSTTTTYGPKHSALLARIHALKESRLRRATRMAPYNRRPSTPLSSQFAVQQHN